MPHVQVVNPGILLNFCNFVKQNVLPVYYKQLYKLSHSTTRETSAQ